MIFRESYTGGLLIPEECEYLKDRVLFINGPITRELADKFIMQIGILSKNQDEDITVVVSSDGGDVGAGLAICDAINAAPVMVNALCMQRAYSMGAVIFSSTPGKRMMAPHAKLMFHEPLINSMPDGRLSSVKEITKSLSACKEDLCKIVAKRSNLPIKKVRDILSSDHYLSLDEAKKLGLADLEGNIFDVIGGGTSE